MKKVILYAAGGLGGATIGFSLTMLLTGLVTGAFSVPMLIVLVLGAGLALGAFGLSGNRPRKALGLVTSGAGAAMFATSVVQLLVQLSRGRIEVGPAAIAYGGVIVLFVGFALFARGRFAARESEGGRVLVVIGAVVMLAGLALVIWPMITEKGVVFAIMSAVGVGVYLYGLFSSQLDDDKSEVEYAFRLLEDKAAEGVKKEHAAVNRRTFAQWFAQLGMMHIVALLAIVYAVFPIMYVISAAFNPSGTLTGSNALFSAMSSSNFESLGNTRYWDWFMNSLQIGIITSIATVLMGAAAAYAFSRYRFKGRRTGLFSLLIIQMFPQILAFVAIFLLLMTLGYVWPPLGLNSKLALICVYLGGALGANTFLMYGFFNTVPKELDEAAKIDGASHAQIFWTIILRLVAPILAVVGLLSFISTFNDFVLARVILQSEGNWTLAVGMYQWVSDLLNQNWGLFAAGAVLGAIPILLLFLFLQRYIVGGLTAGAVKG